MSSSPTKFTAVQAADFDSAFELICTLVDLEEADQIDPRRPNAVFTASVVLWMLVYQRLKPDASLKAAVKHLIETRPHYLPNNKRLRERKLSTSSAGYSTARKKLSLEVVQWFANEVSKTIVEDAPKLFDDRRVFLIDGTTMALAPEKSLQTAFPAASNQYGEGIWPIVLLTVFHDLASGSALLPQIGPMYGPDAVSETELAREGMAQLPADSIVMTDAGFGIFGVGHEARRYGHDFLLRMKKANFESLRKKATLVTQSETHKTYSHQWQPTAKNRKTHPGLPEDAHLDVVLHEVIVNQTLTLYLVTSLTHDAATLGELFKHRTKVEFDIRDFKVVLDTENIRAKSVEGFKKELYTSVVAYNLVTQLRRQAAKINKVEPRRMSFKQTWVTFQTFLLKHMHTEAKHWREAFERALYYATKDILPKRPERTAKREAYSKRPKNQQFKKRKKPPSKIREQDLK